jgi:16S rRNA (guanine966-N2)-methyltransferase
MPVGIRPTQDKVRKALFDILGDISGLSFLELFAGSGAVGLEAVSQGAGEVVFVEGKRLCARVIEKNIESLKPGNCFLYQMGAEQALQTFARQNRVFDLVFLDPPYYHPLRGEHIGGGQGSLAKKTLQTLGAYDIVRPLGITVVEHFKRDNLDDGCGKLACFKRAIYGDSILSFYRSSS